MYTLRSGSPSFKHYNSRGDVVAATDGTGTLTYQAAYEAFGEYENNIATQSWGSTLDRQKSNTKDRDPWGGINEGMRYREGPVFLTRDPLGFVDGPNVYTYVRQNPWTKFDPLGLSAASKVGKGLMKLPKYLKNMKFAGRSDVTTTVLRQSGSKVDETRLTRIDEKYGKDFAVSYDNKGRVSFPDEAIGGTVEGVPFGKGDRAAAWTKYHKQLAKKHGADKGNELFQSARQNYEMHHTYKDGVFELVDTDVHKALTHTGGSTWSRAGLLSMASSMFLPATTDFSNDKNASVGNLRLGFALDMLMFFEPMTTVSETYEFYKEQKSLHSSNAPLIERISAGYNSVNRISKSATPAGIMDNMRDDAVEMAKDYFDSEEE